MAKDPKTEAQEAVDRIIASQSRKKLVVAGPGAGKTYLFRKLLDAAPGNRHQRLVLTFINTLKDDLANSLGDTSDVFTLHSYCQYLLHRHESLRGGLQRTSSVAARMSAFDPGCVKTHTSEKCRKYNSPTRLRAARAQYDLTPALVNFAEMLLRPYRAPEFSHSQDPKGTSGPSEILG